MESRLPGSGEVTGRGGVWVSLQGVDEDPYTMPEIDEDQHADRLPGGLAAAVLYPLAALGAVTAVNLLGMLAGVPFGSW